MSTSQREKWSGKLLDCFTSHMTKSENVLLKSIMSFLSVEDIKELCGEQGDAGDEEE